MNPTDGYSIQENSLVTNLDRVTYKDWLSNLGAMETYSLGYLLSGAEAKKRGIRDLAQGKNYFIPSGKCDIEYSTPECRGRTKHTYVKNIPTGLIPPVSLSFQKATGCNLQGLTEGRGIIPGMIEDIYDINPYEMSQAFTGKGNIGDDVCKKMKLPVGKNIYDSKKENKTWKFEEKCTAGYHSMNGTSDPGLNTKVRKENPHIENAQLPGPKQLITFEEFTGLSQLFGKNKNVWEEYLKPSKYPKYVIFVFLGIIFVLLFGLLLKVHVTGFFK